jgi:hypothetical protein
METILPLHTSFDPETLHAEFSRNLSYKKLKGNKSGLLKILARTLKVLLLLPIVPRLALLGFTFSQPFFIETLLDYYLYSSFLVLSSPPSHHGPVNRCPRNLSEGYNGSCRPDQ